MIGSVLGVFSCTDLEVEEKDSIVIVDDSGNFTGVEPGPALTSSYADLRGFGDQANLYALLEVTSDELLVPTRGTDWGDNGIWRSLHQHTWDATHAHILATWNNLHGNVFRLNQLLAEESAPSAQQAAEGKFLRAYNMFLLLDLFRQIPIRGVNDGPEVDPQVLTPQQAFDYIMTDLDDALENVPSIPPGAGTIKASKASVHFLMAKMLLNKHIYVGDEPAAADMTKVVEHVDAIADEGYELEDGFFDIFKQDADNETIFWTDTGVGNRMWNGLHYFQATPDNTGGGWNGFSTTADFYALFEGDEDSNEPGMGQEERRGYVPDDGIGYGFLVGQQYLESGPLNDRSGKPLIFTKEFAGLSGNNEKHGIRVLKYHPSNGGFTNHLILFRYADAHLMKAEAILRGGTSGDNALDLYNELRSIRGASAAASITLDDILDERGRELYIEGWRRNDQVRFGTFSQPFLYMDVTDETRNVFPIPATAVSTNPNLKQNPGY